MFNAILKCLAKLHSIDCSTSQPSCRCKKAITPLNYPGTSEFTVYYYINTHQNSKTTRGFCTIYIFLVNLYPSKCETIKITLLSFSAKLTFFALLAIRQKGYLLKNSVLIRSVPWTLKWWMKSANLYQINPKLAYSLHLCKYFRPRYLGSQYRF